MVLTIEMVSVQIKLKQGLVLPKCENSFLIFDETAEKGFDRTFQTSRKGETETRALIFYLLNKELILIQ